MRRYFPIFLILFANTLFSQVTADKRTTSNFQDNKTVVTKEKSEITQLEIRKRDRLKQLKESNL